MKKSDKPKIIFIRNPISGPFRRKNLVKKIHRWIDSSKFDYQIKKSKYAGHAKQIAKQAADEGAYAVVAIGGDGSVNEVAGALAGSETALAIIPTGSGNGLARSMGMISGNIRRAMSVINNGTPRAIDLIHSDFGYIVSVAGFGFDSSVARRFRHHRFRGFFSYASAIIKQAIFHFKSHRAIIQVDDEEIDENVFMLSVFNSDQYGYGVGITSESSLSDGLMEVVLIRKFPFIKALWIATTGLIRRLDLSQYTRTFQAKEVRISPKRKRVYQIDGDAFVWHHDMTFKIVPKGIKVISLAHQPI